jgi:phospholipid-translocating ATPase
VYQDIDMYDEVEDVTCVPKAWNITEDLGQVNYIFSDKVISLF